MYALVYIDIGQEHAKSLPARLPMVPWLPHLNCSMVVTGILVHTHADHIIVGELTLCSSSSIW